MTKVASAALAVIVAPSGLVTVIVDEACGLSVNDVGLILNVIGHTILLEIVAVTALLTAV